MISHAVTKGLNPSAPMKNSGIEWLGEVPEHWEVKRLKHLGKALIGLTYDPTEVVEEGEGTLVLRSSNVQEGLIVFDDNVFVNKEIPEKLVTRDGDILTLRDRSRVVPRNDSACVFTKRSVVKMQALRNRVESLESM